MHDRTSQRHEALSSGAWQGEGSGSEQPLDELLPRCRRVMRAAGLEADGWAIAGVFDLSGAMADPIGGDIIEPGRLVVLVHQSNLARTPVRGDEAREEPRLHLGARVILVRLAARHTRPELWVLRGP